jgi:hypothetical protein
MKSSSSGSERETSIRSGLLEYALSITSSQSRSGSPSSVGRKVAGFKFHTVLNLTQGFSHSNPW